MRSLTACVDSTTARTSFNTAASLIIGSPSLAPERYADDGPPRVQTRRTQDSHTLPYGIRLL